MDNLVELIFDKKRDYNKYKAMSNDEKLLRAIKDICKEQKIKLSEIPDMSKYISANLQGDKATIRLRNIFKHSIKKTAEDDGFIYNLYLSYTRYNSQIKGTNHSVKENNLDISRLRKIVRSYNKQGYRINSISVTNQITGKSVSPESKFDFLNLTPKELQTYLIEKLSIKKLSADDGPIDMVGGDEPTEDSGEEDLGGMEGDAGGDLGGGDPGMGDDLGGEPGGMEDPGIPDVGVDWDEAELIYTHDLEDSRENQESEDIDFTHLT